MTVYKKRCLKSVICDNHVYLFYHSLSDCVLFRTFYQTLFQLKTCLSVWERHMHRCVYFASLTHSHTYTHTDTHRYTIRTHTHTHRHTHRHTHTHVVTHTRIHTHCYSPSIFFCAKNVWYNLIPMTIISRETRGSKNFTLKFFFSIL